MPRALIFDCDGTLADTMPVHFRVWNDVLRPYGVSFPEPRLYALGGVPTREIARLLVGEHGLAVDPAALAVKKEEGFLDRIGEVRPVAKVVAIAAAHRGEAPLAVASGGRRRVVELTLRQL